MRHVGGGISDAAPLAVAIGLVVVVGCGEEILHVMMALLEGICVELRGGIC